MKNLLRLFIVTIVVGAANIGSTAYAGQIDTVFAVENSNLSFSSVAAGNLSGSLNNDNITTLNSGTTNVFAPYGTWTSMGNLDYVWNVNNSGGTTEYSYKSSVSTLTFENVNNTGVTWTDFHFQLGYGAGSMFQISGLTDNLDFDAPDRDPGPTSTVFTDVIHNSNELIFSGGTVAPGESVGFSFNFDIPDLSASVPDAYVVDNDTYRFAFRQFPSDDFPVDQPVIPEPSTYILMGLGLAGAGLYRRFKKK